LFTVAPVTCNIPRNFVQTMLY